MRVPRVTLTVAYLFRSYVLKTITLKLFIPYKRKGIKKHLNEISEGLSLVNYYLIKVNYGLE